MRLAVKNFRCHTEKEFVLKPGVTLITGDSGSGKTTIEEAIDYVLYGKLRKVATHGQKKCSVDLHLSDKVQIHRQSGPGRLQLSYNGQKYEDNTAQEIINSMFGEYRDFLAASYMKQGDRCPLMTGSSAEKMDLIRSISFKDSAALDAQEKTKEELKKSQAKVSEFESQKRTADAVLNEFDTQNPAVKSSTFDVASVNIQELTENIAQLEKKVAADRQRLQEIIAKETKLKTLREIRFDDIDVGKLPEQIKEIEEKIAAEKEKIKQIIELRAKKAAFEKLASSKKQREDGLKTLEDEFANITVKIALTAEEEVKAEIKKIEDGQADHKKLMNLLATCGVSSIADLQTKVSASADNIREAKGKLGSLQNSVENKKFNESQKEVLVCPKCSSGLKMESGKLIAADGYVAIPRTVQIPDATEQMIKAKEREIVELEAMKERLGKVRNEVIPMANVAAQSQEQINKLAMCKKWLEMKPKIATQKEELKSFSGNDETQNIVIEGDEAQINAGIKKLEAQQNTLKVSVEKQKEKDKHAKLLEEAEKALGTEKSSDIQEQITTQTKSIEELKTKLDVCSKKSHRDNLQSNCVKAAAAVTEADKRVQGLTKMHEIAKQVERDVLEATVANINAQIARFLEILFVDDPITIEFKTTKDLKSKKTTTMQCSTTIFYKNVKYDDPKQLSGGELDRVSLAMMLALNTLSDSMFLMLDETLSSLNSSLKVNVVELMKQVAGTDKTCLIIEHESTEGVYDHVISMDQ